MKFRDDDDWVLIWSIEHQAWWRPRSNGYTESIEEAGTYTASEATKILEQANIAAFHEAAIPLRMFSGWRPSGVC